MKLPRRPPNLGLPEARVPTLLADLYRDLRDRRLLPLLALLAVAIVAIPILLGGGSEAAPPPSPDAAAGDGGATASGARLEVVAATPGLRDYRKRLQGEPSDPFRQQYTSVPAGARLQPVGGSEARAATSTAPEVAEVASPPRATSAPVTVDPAPPPSTAAVGGPAPHHGGGVDRGGKRGGARSDPDPATVTPPGLGERRLYGWRPTVRFGVAGSDDLTTHEHLALGSMLPTEKPVLAFVGVTENGRRALFSLTREVALVRGEGGCVGGRTDCQILSLRAGQAVDLLTDSKSRSFRLKVTAIEFVELPRMNEGKRRRAGASGAAAPSWAVGVAAAHSFGD